VSFGPKNGQKQRKEHGNQAQTDNGLNFASFRFDFASGGLCHENNSNHDSSVCFDYVKEELSDIQCHL